MSTTLAGDASYAIHGRGALRPVESAPDQHLESRGHHEFAPIAASAGETRRALRRLDMTARGIRALEATGLHDRVVFHAGGLVWRPAGIRGRVDITAEAHVEPSETETSFLRLTTRFSPSDDRAVARLLESWAVVGPLSDAPARIWALLFRPTGGYSSERHLCGLLAEPEWLQALSGRPGGRPVFLVQATVDGRPTRPGEHRARGIAMPLEGLAKPSAGGVE